MIFCDIKVHDDDDGVYPSVYQVCSVGGCVSLKAVASFPQSIVSLAAVFLLSQSGLNTKHSTSVVGGANRGWSCWSWVICMWLCYNSWKWWNLWMCFLYYVVWHGLACVASLAGFASVGFALECCVRRYKLYLLCKVQMCYTVKMCWKVLFCCNVEMCWLVQMFS